MKPRKQSLQRGTRRVLDAFGLVGTPPALAACLGAVCFFSLLPARLGAQAAAAPSATALANPSGETLRMNPFEIAEAKDDSFQSSTMGSASRLALDMKDTPVAYSVINREFIEALGITNLQEAASWSTNTTSFSDGNGSDTFSHPVVVRGNQQSELYGSTGTGSLQRNFYQNVSMSDSYAIESFDFSRGPNSSLFGTGNLGGQQIAQSKRARFDRTSATLAVDYGSWNYRRATLDLNRPISERVGLRLNLVNQDSEGWRNYTKNRIKGLTATVTVKLTNSTELRIEGVSDFQSRHNPQLLIFDNLSGWDGTTVFRGPITNAMSSTNATPGVPNAFGQTLTFNGEPNGITRLGTNYFIYDAMRGTVMNWQNMGTTRKADSTSRTPLYTASAPNGVAFVRSDYPQAIASNSIYNFGYTIAPFGFAGTDEQNILHAAQPFAADRFNRVIANSRFRIPSERFTPELDTPQQIQRSKDLNVNLSQRIGSDVFFELGGDINSTHNKNTGLNNTRFALLDVNTVLPDGSPNPHFLDVYGDTNANQLSDPNSWTDFKTLRTNLGYIKNLGKFGDYTFNINASINHRLQKTRNYALSMAVNADRRLWASDTMRMRVYWNDPSTRQFAKPTGAVRFTQVNFSSPDNPVIEQSTITPRYVLSAWSERFTVTKNLTLQASAKYFGGRLAVTAASRRDLYEVASKSSKNTGDLPADWDNQTIHWRPDAPADYWTMTYIPKNQTTGVATSTKPIIATGNRPRTTVAGLSTRNPFFLNDRFRDDYNAPKVKGGSSNFSTGFVWHATKHISPFLNYSTSYDPPGGGGNAAGGGSGTALDLYGNPVKPQKGMGIDTGVTFNLFDGKISAKFNYYKNSQVNNGYTPPTSTHINSLINANRFDDGNADSVNSRGVPPLPGGDYQDIRNDGQEFEIGANISSRWRMTLNGGWGHHVQTNFGELARKYVPENAELFKLLLEDAGGRLDTTQKPSNAPSAPGLAVINTAVTAALPADQLAAVNAYNNMWIQYENIVVAKDLRWADQPSVNFFTDYTIGSGRLKGLRLGAGVQWQGSLRTGDRSLDTIIDPANPARAIDNPNLGTSDIVYTKGYTTTVGTVGYTIRPAWFNNRDITFNLRVKNLVNNRSATYQGTPDLKVSLRQPENDLTKPNRTAVPSQPNRYSEPISYQLTTTFKF